MAVKITSICDVCGQEGHLSIAPDWRCVQALAEANKALKEELADIKSRAIMQPKGWR